MQHIYVAQMSNPYTLATSRVKISSPDQPWERLGHKLPEPDSHNITDVYVNEGPQSVIVDGKLYLIYSANGCWTDYYSLGALVLNPEGNVLDPTAWKKLPGPLFSTDEKAGVFAPGHNGAFMSADQKEYWLIYHANSGPNLGCGTFRSPRMQPYNWTDAGPVFGRPVPAGKKIDKPSGPSDL